MFEIKIYRDRSEAFRKTKNLRFFIDSYFPFEIPHVSIISSDLVSDGNQRVKIKREAILTVSENPLNKNYLKRLENHFPALYITINSYRCSA